MHVVIAHDKETVSALAKRLFCPASDGELKEVARVILAANPSLKRDVELLEGTVVIVPPIKGMTSPKDVQTGRELAISLVRDLRKRVGGVQQLLAPLLEQRRGEIDETLRLAESAAVRDLAKHTPSVAERLGLISASAKQALAALKALRETSDAASQELDADLDGLMATSGGAGSAAREAPPVAEVAPEKAPAGAVAPAAMDETAARKASEAEAARVEGAKTSRPTRAAQQPSPAAKKKPKDGT
jgi:hypothetical protein